MSYRRQLIGDFVKAQREHPEWPVVVSEGDSWFSFANVIGRLDDPLDQAPQQQRPWALLRLEKAGDEILTILSGAQRARLRQTFERWPLDAVLFSAGGNDIIGPDLLPLLRPYSEGMEVPDLIAHARFDRRRCQIQDCYRELLDLLSDSDQKAKVFVNSYDYAVPSDRPVKLLGIVKVAGPWLLPSLRERGIPDNLHEGVVRLLIDSFVAAVTDVAAEPRGVGRLLLVETRNLVGKDWMDEIHPSRKGVKRIAEAFEEALRNENVLP